MFADKIISFLTGLDYQGPLPEGISVMNPFRDNPVIIPVITQFYRKFYGDEKTRHLILGINPGRFGAGVTGIPFTDTKRLKEKCGLSIEGLETFETSSVFVYDMIDAFGGPVKFYSSFYISAVSPLGFTFTGRGGKTVNYNYYDSKKLQDSLYDFIVQNIKKQLDFGTSRNKCFCLGTGKNYDFLLKLNNDLKFFGKIIPLEHPRYVMQYKLKQKQFYMDKYLSEFGKI
jgi:Uracil DNA glycosylase superfamily